MNMVDGAINLFSPTLFLGNSANLRERETMWITLHPRNQKVPLNDLPFLPADLLHPIIYKL